jgi:hypothetical protein
MATSSCHQVPGLRALESTSRTTAVVIGWPIRAAVTDTAAVLKLFCATGALFERCFAVLLGTGLDCLHAILLEHQGLWAPWSSYCIQGGLVYYLYAMHASMLHQYWCINETTGGW